ncbi:general secretion pathway protein GspN [Bradyrhizobium jicamae]|uniref:General secretion pathway protein GspN n=1 Tax=Bradyrhizobium jicamae TaxID=280332 RepID=A0ABS5FVT8_9BRAD|nr:general secretion pathway protein GspN [Bradyrhizobium jicamae]MBR0800386.1 general secretion pathway protein GspN [Bradyrhizobium jicamae]
MRRLTMGIMVLALCPDGAMALTFSDAPSDDAIEIVSPAALAVPDHSVAPYEAVKPRATAVPGEAQTPSGNPLWATTLTALSGTRERPIFSASRRPPVPAIATAPVPKPAPALKPKEPETPQFTLVGTVAAGGESFGIFLDPSTKAAFRLRAGDYYQGWMLASIQGRAAILQNDQQSVTLAMPQPGAAPQANGVAPAPSNKVVSAMAPPRRERSH